MKKTKVIITVDLPGAGKTTYAKNLQKNFGYVRSNRDDLRMLTFGYKHGLTYKEEKLITAIQTRSIMATIGLQKDLVIDDTNMNALGLYNLVSSILNFRSEVSVYIYHTGIGVHESYIRQKDRPLEDQVPKDVIQSMWDRFSSKLKWLHTVLDFTEVAPDTYSVSLKEQPKYEHDISLENAYIFDIDGTLANNTEGRDFFDYTRVLEDTAHADVVEMAQNLYKLGYHIIIVSGRDASCEDLTKQWLHKYQIPYDELYMRNNKTNIPDEFVKKNIFESHIKGRYNIRGWFDDRISVSNFISNQGITLYRVGNPEWWF
jgi:tRNA uridine 5-carbamoylmethylation protein Kti12